MKERTFILLLAVLALVLVTAGVQAAEVAASVDDHTSSVIIIRPTIRPTLVPVSYYYITGCRVITKPGTYYITRDLVNVRCAIAIDIQCSNVVIQGNNHLVDGIDGASTKGIRVGSTAGGTFFSNVQVKNVRLTDWGTGVFVQQTKSVQLTSVQSRSNRYYGFEIFLGSKPVTITSCAAEANGLGGIDVSDGCQVTISSCTIASNGGSGVAAETSSATVSGSTIRSNKGGGVNYRRGGGDVKNNVIDANGGSGISEAYDSYGHTITGNRITNNQVGIAGTYSPLTIYNNYFSNKVNSGWQTGPLSVAKRRGPNIVGGPYIGGNFWGSPTGLGFSQVTPDRNHDGFCDKPYTALGAVDLLPLHKWP